MTTKLSIHETQRVSFHGISHFTKSFAFHFITRAYSLYILFRQNFLIHSFFSQIFKIFLFFVRARKKRAHPTTDTLPFLIFPQCAFYCAFACFLKLLFLSITSLYELYRKINSDGRLKKILITATGIAIDHQSGVMKNMPKIAKPKKML